MNRQHWSFSIKYTRAWKKILLQTELDMCKSKLCYTIILSWCRGRGLQKNGSPVEQRQVWDRVHWEESEWKARWPAGNSLWDIWTGVPGGGETRQLSYAGYKQSQWSDGSLGAYVVKVGRLMIKGQTLSRWYKNIHNDIYSTIAFLKK